MSAPLLTLYRRMQRWPAGQWLFSRAVCFKAPYFASIAPRITMLEPGRCEGHIVHRRRVTNHIGTVHAIALCNLAELTAGLMVDASLPKGMRWIPKGMEVKYLAKATGTQHAVATPAQAIVSAEAGYALPVNVQVRDTAGTVVFEARIDMWVSPVKRG
ncbi:hotdog fold domain-containing protein [Stenotrophomonas rhizophila]|jgi:acyl-coenzyme A thioesterase PaaI-like protein|uniref:hotdog fold domain-containing protein n=1 Tax=Stenotrophomonas rhizophila TaxID=216778 RepID=UPI000B87FA9B|nr:hotdog fold domain-containing protein [Stenotrophomonas rhizophila]